MIFPGRAMGASKWTFASDSSGTESATSCDTVEPTSGHTLISSIMLSATAGNRLPSSTRPAPLTAPNLISPLAEYLARFIFSTLLVSPAWVAPAAPTASSSDPELCAQPVAAAHQVVEVCDFEGGVVELRLTGPNKE